MATLKYQSLIYMYSKIMNYYNVHNTSPKQCFGKILVCTDSWSSCKIKCYIEIWNKLIGIQFKYGYVKLGPFGNSTSKNKVAVIVGVHPQEEQTHIAMLNAISKVSIKFK